MKPTTQLHQLGQSLWLDNITRDLLSSGILAHYLAELSITGLTSNPTIFDQAIRHTAAYDADIHQKLEEGKSTEAIFFELAMSDLRHAATLLLPIFKITDSVDGWVSLEVSPLLANDTEGTIEEARRLYKAANCPNLFIKIPGTPAGLKAIEESIFAGIAVNVTLLFSVKQYLAAAEAYLCGIERRISAGLDTKVFSVASVFVSRWDTGVKQEISPQYHNQLGIVMAMLIYKNYQILMTSVRWQKILQSGACPQRLLWASTGTKDLTAPDTLYVDALVAPGSIVTVPEKTLLAFADHGNPESVLPIDGGLASAVLEEFRREGVDDEALAERLQVEGVASFVKSWEALLSIINEKGRKLANVEISEQWESSNSGE
ncbi:transaldolase [Undibacterium sp. RTI2.1]|uniref:transaldolase n=1 Tax=unclassified Undibacterium TaxID=2630295 RepID=UPI002AB3F013|nr:MULTISPECIES: transaldolase [unclassified Undibacterium]MDY7540685.1 transaldolase [Undibacterium sp. 5I1]MEB0032567.1 transaldolase [Undibacterium sp. RTI2.1]MEB0118628.1 transaldolase [Undibacterium sp. RTI2.2]MEB0232854.1 transaldolase [Undibacterium sp. 10I3]MEB0259725.1 transaldolase [Undibacterium sp. 5I1]